MRKNSECPCTCINQELLQPWGDRCENCNRIIGGDSAVASPVFEERSTKVSTVVGAKKKTASGSANISINYRGVAIKYASR